MEIKYVKPSEADEANQKILDGWLTPTWEENPITAKKKRIAEANQINHEENAKILWQALNDLTFECYGLFDTRPPSITVYNKTFMSMDKLRKEYSVK